MQFYRLDQTSRYDGNTAKTEKDHTMRVASFILPVTHPDREGGDDILKLSRYDEAHQYARSALLAAYGGFTASAVIGAWTSPTSGKVIADKSVRYEVAADWAGVYAHEGQKDVAEFIAIAKEAGKNASQECVIVFEPWGECDFHDCKEVEVTALFVHRRL